MRVLVAGAGGFIGRPLIDLLTTSGHEVVRLVRPGSPGGRAGQEVPWAPERGELDGARLSALGLDAVISLGGVGIADARWTEARKQLLRSSRIDSTALLARTIAALEVPPRVFVSASAIGWYGSRGDEPLDEDSGPGVGFLADLCRDWEAAARPAEARGIRTVLLRTGVVLGRGGGALDKMLLPFKLGAGGVLGSGAQWMSWIALEDVTRAILFALEDRASAGGAGGAGGAAPARPLVGPVNAVAPSPVTNRTLTKALGRALGRPTFMAVPGFAAKLAFGGELAEETLLASQNLKPKRLLEAGFEFRWPELDALLEHLVR